MTIVRDERSRALDQASLLLISDGEARLIMTNCASLDRSAVLIEVESGPIALKMSDITGMLDFCTHLLSNSPAPADPRMDALLVALGSDWRLLAELKLPGRAQRYVMSARRLKAKGLVESDLRGGVVFWRRTQFGDAAARTIDPAPPAGAG